MTNDCLHPDCFHLDHGVGKDPVVGLLNTAIDQLNSLNNSLEKYSKRVEELTLRQSEFENYFLKNRAPLGFVASSRYLNEYKKLKEIRKNREEISHTSL